MTLTVQRKVLEPHNGYEPLIVRFTAEVDLKVVRYESGFAPERLLVKRFSPIYTDRWVCVYATNGSPRDRMRHDARLRGERCRTHPYTRIAEKE